MAEKTVREVLKKHTSNLMAVPGVVGIGEGKCQGMPCILVFVVKKNKEMVRQVPNSIEGYTVQIKESGEFHSRMVSS